MILCAVSGKLSLLTWSSVPSGTSKYHAGLFGTDSVLHWMKYMRMHINRLYRHSNKYATEEEPTYDPCRTFSLVCNICAIAACCDYPTAVMNAAFGSCSRVISVRFTRGCKSQTRTQWTTYNKRHQKVFSLKQPEKPYQLPETNKSTRWYQSDDIWMNCSTLKDAGLNDLTMESINLRFDTNLSIRCDKVWTPGQPLHHTGDIKTDDTWKSDTPFRIEYRDADKYWDEQHKRSPRYDAIEYGCQRTRCSRLML